jgi:aryl-alcohol dehydrogenase-like predicted oxidoreductase
MNQDIRLGLGTVQFGLNYGVSNTEGKTSHEEVKNILSICQKENIRFLDTAFSYGESEKVLGEALKGNEYFSIITKTPSFRSKERAKEEINKVRECFDITCSNLQVSALYGILIHDARDLLFDSNNDFFREVMKLKNAGYVQKIGVSVYPEDDVISIISRYNIDLIQAPLNVFDQRILSSGILDECKKRNIEVHVRSLFLQGLLLMPFEKVPAFFNPIKQNISRYHNFCKENSLTLIEGAYCFARSVGLTDVLIIGVNNSNQLRMNIDAFNNTQKREKDLNFSSFALSDSSYLTPSKWRLK